MPAPKTPRKPAVPARVPSHKKVPTLLERLQAAQRWTINRNAVTNVPERLLRWDGKRLNPSCSVSLRLAASAPNAAQKALWEAALTLEALTAERERIVSLLGAGAGADGKSVADWLRAISDAQQEAVRWKTKAGEWEKNYQEATEGWARVRNELSAIQEQVEAQSGEIQQSQKAIPWLEEERDKALALVATQGRDLDQIHTIVMDALGIEPERRADYPLLEGAETLVAALADKTLAVGELRGSLTNRNEQISRLVQERDRALAENKDLAGKLTAERGANVAHQHARRMGWLMSIGALLLSIPLTLWISGFWSWRAGR